MSVTVFNVEQGDSFLIQFDCFSRKINLLVDAGCANKKVYKKLSTKICNKSEVIHILITHSHNDHIGGVWEVMKRFNVGNVFLPNHLAEILEIKKILHKKYSRLATIKKSILCHKKVFFLNEGNCFKCDMEKGIILNPPKDVDEVFAGLDEVNDIEMVVGILNNLGVDINLNNIEGYEPSIIPENAQENYIDNARYFVKRFFTTLGAYLENATVGNVDKIIREHLELISNRISIVFNFCDKNKERWLFTGDADIYAFNRIIKGKYKNFINADYLKIPHHGSKENIDSMILSQINPRVAIVSHGNLSRKGGDPHPNIEVINFLNSLGINVFYTNDVIKKGKPNIPSNHMLFKSFFDFL